MPVKKSLYIFLTSLLGALLFLILHRIVAFAYFVLLYFNYGTFGLGLSINDILAFDYVSLIMALLLGGWYGVWLGLYWFDAVYGNSGQGFLGHVAKTLWPRTQSNYNLREKIAVVETKLEHDLDQLESLVETQPIMAKKRVVKRKAAK